MAKQGRLGLPYRACYLWGDQQRSAEGVAPSHTLPPARTIPRQGTLLPAAAADWNVLLWDMDQLYRSHKQYSNTQITESSKVRQCRGGRGGYKQAWTGGHALRMRVARLGKTNPSNTGLS